MRSKNSGFSLVEMGLVMGVLALIMMLALMVMPALMAKTRDTAHNSLAASSASSVVVASAPASASVAPKPSLSGASTPAPAPVTGPLVRQFHDVELIQSVQAIDTLPDAQKPKDFASRGDWLYVVTDEHVLVNGRWADSLCPALLVGRPKVSSGTSLVALRGLLFQRLEDKRRMAVRGLELMGSPTVDALTCPGVSVTRSGFSYLGKPVAFAAELTLPR